MLCVLFVYDLYDTAYILVLTLVLPAFYCTTVQKMRGFRLVLNSAPIIRDPCQRCRDYQRVGKEGREKEGNGQKRMQRGITRMRTMVSIEHPSCIIIRDLLI